MKAMTINMYSQKLNMNVKYNNFDNTVKEVIKHIESYL